MNPIQQGKIVRWEGNRGFGFIQPDDGGAKVFVHISAIGKAVLHPRLGDRLTYTVQTQIDGKICAVNARLLDVPPPFVFDPPGFDWTGIIRSIVGVAMLGAAMFYWNTSGKINRPQSSKPPQNNSVSSLDTSGNKSYIDSSSGYTDYGYDTRRQNGSFAPPGYTIKGNISVNNGKHYYHTPGMPDYSITTIDSSRGEQWFRTEAEAVAAGWEKARPYQGRNPY